MIKTQLVAVGIAESRTLIGLIDQVRYWAPAAAERAPDVLSSRAACAHIWQAGCLTCNLTLHACHACSAAAAAA